MCRAAKAGVMLDSNMNQEVLSAPVIDPEQPCVLVLAAGRGERFLASGGSSHKLQAMLGLQTVLQTTLAAVQASGLPWHLEYGPHPGMGDSIAAAVKATAGANGWLVLPADLPLIQASTLQQLALQLAQLESRELRVIQPFYQGQKGHPVAFSRAAAQELAELSGDLGAASIVRNAAENQRLWRWDCDDIGCVLDVDTVQALEEARRIWQARNS
ncbi:molybdopterin-guanine dinucleotide biosynthesis protein MobA [Comamonas thiooxydans]|nr:molybdopterin-guanine dinucleotide biosynthesis protein MobA [Comamonas thiooxydans]KGG98655.1 molybdopterin-guanine dinucleotide biosynthesis protein MobA [Comamonas thiooxydans]KGH04972.1 molybdopterin-guanine dinucleotide biosynthesis protein MobA [Comamonas thiooxydans]KGH13755.1 molybdopterin-guanine dinucleotide biosynthesis protein MobA [Comamonas thiooxydans]